MSQDEDIPSQRERQKALEERLLDQIGTPDDLHHVDIKELWDMNHYRVNVYRKVKRGIAMTDSFFAVCTETFPVFYPELTFRYYDQELARVFDGEPNCLVPYALEPV